MGATRRGGTGSSRVVGSGVWVTTVIPMARDTAGCDATQAVQLLSLGGALTLSLTGTAVLALLVRFRKTNPSGSMLLGAAAATAVCSAAMFWQTALAEHAWRFSCI